MLFLQMSTEIVHFADYCEVHVLSRTIPHLKKKPRNLVPGRKPNERSGRDTQEPPGKTSKPEMPSIFEGVNSPENSVFLAIRFPRKAIRIMILRMSTKDGSSDKDLHWDH